MNFFRIGIIGLVVLNFTALSCTKEISFETKSEKRFINRFNEDVTLSVSSDLTSRRSYTVRSGDSLIFEAVCSDAGDGRYCVPVEFPEFPEYFGIQFADNSIAEYKLEVCDSIGKDPSTSFQQALGNPNTCGFSFANVDGIVVLTYIIDSVDYRWAD